MAVQQRSIVIGCFVVFCSICLFLMYYKPNTNFLSHLWNWVSEEKAICVCPNGLNQEGNQTVVDQTAPEPLETGNQNAQLISRAENDEPDTIILIWMWPYGVPFNMYSCADYNIQGCQMTDDKTLYNKAHGVLFYHRDILEDLSNMPQEPRPRFQKWIWFNRESPKNSPMLPALDNLFQMTANYRQDATIHTPYGYLVELTGEDKSFELPAKDKLVCWIVSHWNPSFRRVTVYDELNKHINVEVYGRHFNKFLTDEDYPKTISACKFYLAFENSIYKDYITEKLYRSMLYGAVPVVLGPSRQNYENFVPTDSFIHVDDFPNQKELADRLLFLDQNDEEYMKYHSWRKDFKVKDEHENICRACDYIRRNKVYKTINLNQWYWG